MGLPAVMAVAGGLQVAQGFASMAASNQAASAEMEMYENQRAVAVYNKQVVDQDRQAALQANEIASQDKERENRRMFASLKAAYGTSGFETTGSPLAVLQDTSVEMALDQRRVDYQGNVINRQYGEEMKQLDRDAADASKAKKNVAKAAKLKTVSSVLGMASSGAQSYGNYKLAGG